MQYPTGTAPYHHHASYTQYGRIHFSFGIKVDININRGELLAYAPSSAEIGIVASTAAVAISADSDTTARSLWFNNADNGLYAVNSLPVGYYIVIG